jgi:hypothetical protein
MHPPAIELEYNPSDSDSESDSDEIDEIYDMDSEHNDNEKENYKYYIGIAKLIRPYGYYLLTNSISSNMFFLYPFETIRNYLMEYSIIETYNPKVDILKLQMIDNIYTVIKKTVWIRLIQRHWRKVLSDRMKIRIRRGQIYSQRHFEMTGKYPSELSRLPGLYGMLSRYNNA